MRAARADGPKTGMPTDGNTLGIGTHVAGAVKYCYLCGSAVRYHRREVALVQGEQG